MKLFGDDGELKSDRALSELHSLPFRFAAEGFSASH